MLSYYLYKLHFSGPVHIGPDHGQNPLESSLTTMHSDSFFSALCVEAARYGGSEMVENLVDDARQSRMVLSDLLPCRGEELFLPKPNLPFVQARVEANSENRKEFKKMRFVPISMWTDYCKFCFEEKPFSLKKCKEAMQGFSYPDQRQRVAVEGSEDPEPYFLQATSFPPDSSLYCILGFDSGQTRSKWEQLLNSLAWSGIGGKRSSGWGKFEISSPDSLENHQVLHTGLSAKDAPMWMTLNTSLPTDEELQSIAQQSSYLLCRRGGFVDGKTYKKRTVYAFSAGSCVNARFEGDVLDLAPKGRRAVYRMLKPILLGVFK